MRCVSAVDDECGAGDEFGFVRREVHDTPGDVVGFAHVSERMQQIDQQSSIHGVIVDNQDAARRSIVTDDAQWLG